MKKLSFIFISLVMVILTFAICVSAADTLVAEGTSGENVTWKLYDRNSAEASKPHYRLVFSGEGTLVGYTSDGVAVGYGNYAKSQFAPWKEYIFEIIVEDGITAIGQGGLGFFGYVSMIEIPQSVTSIGGSAFAANGRLERVTVTGNRPFLGADLSNITSISNNAFDDCFSLRYIHLNPSFEGKLPSECFGSCNSLTMFKVPAGVTSLVRAFDSCQNLKALIFEGDPQMGSTVLSGAKTDGLTIYTSVEGGAVDTFAKTNGIAVSYDTPDITSEFYSEDPNVIDIGKCAADVFYRIVKEGDSHVMYTFGTGDTMSAISFGNTGVGYGSISKCYWGPYKDLINKVVLSDNVKTMSGQACGNMKNLTHLEITENLTGITGACFEASSKFGCIYMRGNEPIEGHLDLTNIMRLGAYTFDGCAGIKSVEFAEYPTTRYLGTELFKNCTRLHTVKLPFNLTDVRKYTFLNCDSLKNIIFYSDTKIHELAFDKCDNIETITGLRNSYAQEYAEANGITFVNPNIISIYSDGKLDTEIDVVDGAFLYPQLVDGKVCLLYTDEGCTVPFDYSKRVYDDMTLYAKLLVSFEGYMVRVSEYNGLRAIYNFDVDTAKGDSLYNIKAMGSIASLERDIRGTTTMTYDDKHIFLNKVVVDSTIVGKLVAYPNGTVAQFAHTATGYEKDGAINARNATEELYFRCFVVLEDKNTGALYEIYTDVISATLKEKCQSTAEIGADILASEELEFIDAAAKSEYDRDVLYTKAELLEYIDTMYKDPDHILYGQHIDVGNVDSFANNLATFKDETGDYPAVIAVDQGTINGAGLTEEETLIFRQDLVEYAKRGGIISLSFHMDNPKDESLYCRGTLGREADFDALMTSGTETNASLMRSLETAADTLQYFEDLGIPVLWRPLHEMNGGWFWWCTVQTGSYVLDGEYVARLWRYFYDYLENECDLDNLIWVYSPNYSNNTDTTKGTQHVMHCYPGDDYVDMVGCDWYTGSGNYADIDGAGKSYSSIVATGKPACITEFGPSGILLPVDDGEHPYKAMTQLQLMKDITYELGHSMVYFLNWSGKWSIYKMGDSSDFMASEMIYGANESYVGLIGNKLK